MKTEERPNEEPEHSRNEADLGASIHALFLRCPRLHGFAVRGTVPPSAEGFCLQFASGLFVTDVSIDPSCGFDSAVAHSKQIASTLRKLINECPEVRELLCGRTFARVLH